MRSFFSETLRLCLYVGHRKDLPLGCSTIQQNSHSIGIDTVSDLLTSHINKLFSLTYLHKLLRLVHLLKALENVDSFPQIPANYLVRSVIPPSTAELIFIPKYILL